MSDNYCVDDGLIDAIYSERFVYFIIIKRRTIDTSKSKGYASKMNILCYIARLEKDMT